MRTFADRAILAARSAVIPAIVVAFVLAGTALRVGAADPRWGDWTWMAGLVLTGAPVAWRTLRGMAHGHFATDIVAMLAIVTAVILGQPLAGLIVVLMQTGGESLERYAEGRASRAVRALEEQAPRIAHRLEEHTVVDVAVEQVRVGDRLIVRPGEMVPCDCVVLDGESHVDTSRLTGEPLPLHAAPEVQLMSGSLNGDGALVVTASALARDSQYARIVDLVRSAEASKAPLQRLADRYAVWFTPITLLVCAASWIASGDVLRVLAVLVVATPCPLILATPIAIIGGINRAASRQVIIRTGGALERLDAIHVAVFDKTGTLTIGVPMVGTVTGRGGFAPDEVLRLAAAVEQQSGHQLARSVVQAALADGAAIARATGVREAPGQGVSGQVEGRMVAVGSPRYVGALLSVRGAEPERNGALVSHVAVDGMLAGVIEYADRVRTGAAALVSALGSMGIQRTILLSGDDERNAHAIASAVGISEARGHLLPGEKVEAVAALSAEGHGVLMVGDGTNDAPALSRADVGIALAGHGGGITAEAADIVILNDDLSRVAEAIEIGRRTMRIARQSIWVGLSLSGAAMVVAAFGYISPVFGALLQEVIDVAVILNAVRASTSGGDAA